MEKEKRNKQNKFDIMEKIKINTSLLNELWRSSYKKNKLGIRIFSFPLYREKLKKYGITENMLNKSLPYVRKELLKIMSGKNLIQWIFHPTEKELNVEDYLESSFNGFSSSSSESSSSLSHQYPPLST